MPQSDPQQPDINSKSQRKEDMRALQKIGESLMKLPESELVKLDLPATLLTAILHAQTLGANEARRRQLQYIGKLMREVDPEPLKAALKRIQRPRQENTAQFHQAEKWREMLISSGDDALNTFLEQHPDCDRQQLRQLIRNAQKDRKNGKDTGGETTLFRFVLTVVKDR